MLEYLTIVLRSVNQHVLAKKHKLFVHFKIVNCQLSQFVFPNFLK